MEYSKALSTVAMLIICQVAYIQACGPELCDRIPCANGDCVLPPASTQPTCNCSAGFRIDITNPNNCLDINECSDLFYSNVICGVTYVVNNQGILDTFNPIATGTCLNTFGGYFCLCFNTFQIVQGQKCIDTGSSPFSSQFSPFGPLSFRQRFLLGLF